MVFYAHHNVFRISFKHLLKVEYQQYRLVVKNFPSEKKRNLFYLGSATSSTFSPSFSDQSNLHHGEKGFSDPITPTDDVFTEQTNSQRRKSIKSPNNSTTQTHEPPPPSASAIHHQPLPNSPISNNKKRRT